jgi:hypothetical protein
MMDDNQLLDHIRCNLIDVENEQQKTNELLGQVLEELRKLNKVLTPVPFPAGNYGQTLRSGYTCMFCGGWISTPDPHNCRAFGGGVS